MRGDAPTDDPADEIRRVYAKADVAAVGRFVDPNRWENPEDSDALSWAWRDASGRGATLPEFVEWLREQVTAWVVEVRAAGEEKFTAGWRPTKFAAWISDADAAEKAS